MKRLIAEWLWRLAVLAALAWIGASLHQIHEDLLQPADDGQSVATAPDGSADGSADGNADGSAPSDDALRQQLDLVNQKLDAIMIAMAQLRR
ncbi:MAG: hypothetical protein KGI90_14210 [Burkholderiales bacterium]|nr:hypothetical protein [Burkholderiales bacterium]MDE2277833.1 hypothetical protein [Burkholderiales bacterium]